MLPPSAVYAACLAVAVGVAILSGTHTTLQRALQVQGVWPWRSPPTVLPPSFRPVQLRGPFPTERSRIAALFASVSPVVFDTSPADGWPALAQWATLEGLAGLLCRNAPVLSDVCACGEAHRPTRLQYDAQQQASANVTCDFLYYDTTKPFMSLRSAGWKQPYDVIKVMDCASALQTMGNSSSSQLLYFSRPIQELGAGWHDLMQPLSPFVDHNERVNLWVGSKGTVARLHYDASPNWFLQVSGRKRFLLAPPSAHWALYQFSALHPGHRQSKLDPRDVNSTMFPRFSAGVMQEVVLEPGESLYIPPFYFHQVESLSPSISINVYHEWEGKHIVSSIMSLIPQSLSPIPDVPADTMRAFRAAEARSYLATLVDTTVKAIVARASQELPASYTRTRTELLTAAHALVNSSVFASHVLETRLSHAQVDPLLQWSDEVTHPGASVPLHVDIQTSRHPDIQTGSLARAYAQVELCAPDQSPAGVPESDVHTLTAIAQVVSALLALPVYGAVPTVLADYAELVAADAVGAEHTAAFFAQCFLR